MVFIKGFLALSVFVLLAWAISENRRRFSWRTVLVGTGLQFGIALLLLKTPVCLHIFMILNRAVLALEHATEAGTSFVFGYVGGGDAPFEVTQASSMVILAFQKLPLVLIMSALSALFFYWKVLPRVIRAFSWLLRKSVGIGGAEGVGLAANVFMGMVEAPLLIRPYISRLTRSELFTIMTCGMSTVAGTVLALYAGFLRNTVPDAMGHLLTASLISVPAAITMAKVMIPETEAVTAGDVTPPQNASSAMDAVTKGTAQGMELLISIIGMLIVLVALVHLVNLGLGLLPDAGGEPPSLEGLLGFVMAPVVWLMGVPWHEARIAGSLMGTKTVLNELLAYIDLSRLPQGTLNPRSLVIMTYAMCGFANPGSLGIMIGGLGTMAPDRRSEIVALGWRSILAGTMATCMTGTIAGMLV